VSWVQACLVDDVEEEDVIPFSIGGKAYAIYRSDTDEFYATDGLCTHEQVEIADGLVMGCVIECPRHNGRFDYRTGKPLGAPVVEPLVTYPVKVEGDAVFLDVG
jgi:3-phenylpropionate/trans-cinnamate dioxygenase ferredoxin subunit